MSEKNAVERRTFIKTAAAAGAALAFPAIIPSSALGADGNTAPSNRIVAAALGVGWMGTDDMVELMQQDGVQIVAVCDTDQKHIARAKGILDNHYENTDCAVYGDFRSMFGRGDLDVVVMGLPDHWHAIPVIAAAEAGLDIYGEKPLARSIGEGRAMAEAVTKHKRVWQTGSWQRSVPHFRRACELVRNGRIGKIQRVEVGLPTGHEDFAGTADQTELVPPPPNLDYERWLGPAPVVPYCLARSHKNWRWWLDYSGGQLTDWAGHHIDIAHWGLGFDHTGPVEIEGKGVYPESGVYNTPGEYEVHCKYANGIEMTIADTTKLPMGAKWIGEDGWVHVNRDEVTAGPESILEEEIGPDEVQLYKTTSHMGNFVECVRSRKKTITPIETAHRSISVGLLGEIAMTTGRKIKWDPEKEEIANDPGATALLTKPYRAPWVL